MGLIYAGTVLEKLQRKLDLKNIVKMSNKTPKEKLLMKLEPEKKITELMSEIGNYQMKMEDRK